jgi:hypothetical protein
MPRKQVQQEESLTPIDDAEREAYLFELRRELAQQQKEQQSSVAAVGLMPGSSASSRVLPSSYLSARSLADRSEVFKEVGARLHLSERSPAVGRPQPPSASPGHPHHNSHRSARAATARPRDDEGARAGSSRRRGGGSPRRASLSSMTARSFADYDFHPASRLSSRRANTPLTARLAALEARKEEEERARRERDRLKRERARRAAQRMRSCRPRTMPGRTLLGWRWLTEGMVVRIKGAYTRTAPVQAARPHQILRRAHRGHSFRARSPFR